ncbi:hypothetical protein P4O66_010427, partial [Electrophorus voltai]
MFAKATTNFVTEIDPDGCLVPVFRLNESDNLALLSLVIKRKRFWFWQQPKYLTTDFSLNDVLVGDKDIDTAVIETDFLKYNSTLQSNTSGGADADFGPGRVNVGGEGSSKLASSFGNLTKQEIDLKRLLDDSKDRVLDLQHSLVQQTRENRREVLGVVKECITTTQPCTISEVVHKVGSCGAFLGFTVPRKIQVSVKNGGHQSNSSVSVEIPANTALAYSIIELRVKSTGRFEFEASCQYMQSVHILFNWLCDQFWSDHCSLVSPDLCLMPHNRGGFETDGVEKGVTVLCSTPPEAPNRQPLQEELEKLQPQFKVLSDLPSNTRHCLFQQFSILLKDRTAISVLDLALEDVSCGKKPDLSSLDKVPSLRSAVQTILELFQGDDGTGDAQADSTSSGKQLSHSAMSATHLLSSALEEMNDSVLSVLESCCCPRTIQALQLLWSVLHIAWQVQHVVENKKCSLKDSTLAILGDEN